MKIEQIRMNNFLSYRGVTEIDLRDVSICAIIGQNGAGKSSILEAITYALFGRTRANSEDELSFGYNSEFKRWLVPLFGVGLHVQIGEWTYQIERLRHQKKGGELVVMQRKTENGNTIEGTHVQGLREGQEFLNKILGMDYESFVSSVIMKQDGYEAFMKMAPGEAKEVLMKIIGIGQFEDKRDAAAEKAREIGVRISGLETVIDMNMRKLADTRDPDQQLQALKDTAQRLKKQAFDKETDMKAAELNLKEVRDNLKKFQETLDEIMSLKKELALIGPTITRKENEIDRLIGISNITLEEILQTSTDDWELVQKGIAEKIEDLEEKISELRDQTVQCDTLLSTYRSSIVDLKSNPQKCLLGKEECDGILKQQCAEKIEAITKTGLKVKEDREKAAAEQESLMILLKEQKQILEATKAARQVATDMPMLKTGKESMDRAEAKKNQLETYLQENRDSTEDDARALEFEVKGYEKGIRDLQAQAMEIQKQIGSVEQAKADIKKLAQETEKMKKMLPDQKEQLFIYETLKKALSKDGIPALMIETVVPQLETHANELLDKLSNGQISVEFRLQKKLKSGGFSDSFEIYVTDEQGTRSVSMYSGGEKYRIILAIHSAFSRYLIHRSGTPLKFLCIDEPTGLDDQGIERFVETLGGLRDGYEQIFVITHLKSLVEYFPQTLMVEKTTMGSVVRSQGLQALQNKGGKNPPTFYDL
jgi:exonuclease SbcC